MIPAPAIIIVTLGASLALLTPAHAQLIRSVADRAQPIPNRSAIPEKIGPPLQARPANPPEELKLDTNEGSAQRSPRGSRRQLLDAPRPRPRLQ